MKNEFHDVLSGKTIKKITCEKDREGHTVWCITLHFDDGSCHRISAEIINCGYAALFLDYVESD